jgi:hypothetical protein
LFVCLLVSLFLCFFVFLSFYVFIFPLPHLLSGMAFLKTIVADIFGRNVAPWTHLSVSALGPCRRGTSHSLHQSATAPVTNCASQLLHTPPSSPFNDCTHH